MDDNARLVALPELGMLTFTGAATVEFLQGQLSCDVARLQPGGWIWGGYLNPKGRVLATFITVALGPDSIGLVMRRGLLALAEQRLKMYILRAKTSCVVDERGLAGGIGIDAAPAAGQAELGPAAVVLGLGDGMVLALGAAAAEDDQAWNAWQREAIERGQPWLDAALQEQLTAHMLSLDLAGGISFDKGCYVGQEIVVRSHHRGKIKKRAYVVSGAGAPPAPGAAIASEIHAGQSAGGILYAARTDAGFVALANLRKDAVSGGLTLADGTAVTAAAPPYGLIDPKFEAA